MPMKKPTFFTKVLQTLKQLSTTRGFSIKQITDHLQLLGVRRNLKEIKSIVERSLKYGVKNKLLQENCGKYHLIAARLQSLHVKSQSKMKKKKRVRFKKSKSNATKKSIKHSGRRKSRKASINTKKGQKSSEIKKSRTSSRIQSTNSTRDTRSKKRIEEKHTETPSESGETTDVKSNEGSPSAQNSNSELIVENKETKEPLNVTPDRDVHDNCVNKKRNPVKESDVREPPGLESEAEVGMEPPRPTTKLRKTPSRVRKELKHKYKHYCPHVEREKRLKDLIPDDKMYKKYKTRSRRSCGHVNSEESSDHDSRSFKKKTHRKCHHHNCHKERHHHSHQNLDGYLLQRKTSNTVLDHRSRTVFEPLVEILTPFEVFLEANHSKLETIAENMSAENPAENVDNETTKDKFDPSYIN